MEYICQNGGNMINKDYNHPCVIVYSIGNEIPETGDRFDKQFGKKLADKIRELDDSRYTVETVVFLWRTWICLH